MDTTGTQTGLPIRQNRRAVSSNDPQLPIQNEHRRVQSEPPTIASPIADTGELDDEQEYYGGAYDALAPVGISFRGRNSSVSTSNAGPELFARAREYLHHKFGVTSFHVLGRWLVLGCYPAVPSTRMPGLAGGFLAVWRPPGEMYLEARVGKEGGIYLDEENEDDFEVDEAILAPFEPLVIPTPDAIIGLASLFPECNALTFIAGTIVIEYPETDESSFQERLQTLPDYLPRAPFDIRYDNGPLPNTPQRRRLCKPRPQPREGSQDANETDCVTQDGKLYPGNMVSSTTLDGTIYSSVSAGILLFNQNDVKLTCPWHNWEDHAAKCLGLLGKDNDDARQVFAMARGEPETKKIGHVVKRVGNTGIALASLLEEVTFENIFMDIKTCAKRLVHSSSLHVGDMYVVDGKRLLGLGARFELNRRPVHRESVSPSGDGAPPPPPVTYVSRIQGVSATTDDMKDGPPYTRDRACGALLVRVRDGGEGEDSSPKEMLARGEVCGVFHYPDPTPMYRTHIAEYLVYTDVFDPLIEEGWRVVPAHGEEVEDNVL
ncbi:hypothetical protein B0J18DRAFT_433675 [Chaetomium sp. MPI-SDFR-AT-0129]|nr:hypothetical protein B0J18DRAFT_433675 [Chaetomium sp. MPI-SDFR-AT-0129]